MKDDGLTVQGRYTGVVDGEVVPGLIMGITGRQFHGRDVIVLKHPPGLFGTRATGRERLRELTICNGIINQCTLAEPPSPYWAVLDAMCELKSGFTRSEVIDWAVKHTVGESKRHACEICWDVLRNHHRHERKRDAGMAYMIDTLPKGRLAIRAREPGETMAYFQGEAERRKAAEAMLAEPTSTIESAVAEKEVVG